MLLTKHFLRVVFLRLVSSVRRRLNHTIMTGSALGKCDRGGGGFVAAAPVTTHSVVTSPQLSSLSLLEPQPNRSKAMPYVVVNRAFRLFKYSWLLEVFSFLFLN